MTELWRRRAHFVGVTSTLVALCTLAVILVSLAAGLWAGATGAIGKSSTSLIVFSRDSLNSFSRSRIALAEVPRLARIPGVAAVGAMGTLATTMTMPSTTTNVAVIGTVPGGPGAPARAVSGRMPGSGEEAAAVDVTLRADGVRLGGLIRSPAGGPALRVVGFVADDRFGLLPTVWVSVGTWQTLGAAAQPETRSDVPTAQVLTVRLAPGASMASVRRAIDTRLNANAITRGQAMLAIPGASAMRSTIDELIAAVLVVAGVVTALFAALLTAERRTELARLRALGASVLRLAIGLLVQVELPIVVATGTAYLITGALLLVAPPQFPVALPFSRALGLGALILVTGALGTAGSMLRIVRMDPAMTMEDM